MTFLLPTSEPDPTLFTRGAGQSIPTYWQGLGASFGAVQTEQNANFQRQSVENERRLSMIDEAVQVFGRDRLAEVIGEASPLARARGGLEAPSMLRADPTLQGAVLDAIRADAAQRPGAYEGIDLTDDRAEREAQTQLQQEHQDAQDMLDMLPAGQRATAEFVGGMAGATADVRNLPFLLAGGGTGGVLRVAGREAMLNMAAEAATMPARYAMADYLEIEDPEFLQAMAFAAGAGAILGGGVEAAARGVVYFRNRNKRVGLRDSVSQEAIVNQVEDALAGGEDVVPVAQQAMEANPAPSRLPPLILRADQQLEPDVPVSGPRDPAPRDESDIREPWTARDDLALDMDSVVAGLQDAVAEARREDFTQGSPLLARFGSRKKSVEDLRLDPQGPAGRELEHMGVERRRHLAMFKRGGRGDVDNLVATDWEADFPGIRSATGTAPDAHYLDRQGMLDLIRRSSDGDYSWLEPRARREELERQLEEAVTARDEGRTTSQDDYLDGYDSGRGFTIQSGTDTIEVAGQMNRYLQERGYSLDDAEFIEIRDELAQYGGDGELLIERAAERAFDIGEGRNGSPNGAREGVGGEGQGGAGEGARDAAGGDRGAAPAERGDTAPVSERTPEGEQILTEGVAPITERDRLRQRAAAKLQGKAAAADIGLFDVASRSQMDWLDDPAGKAAQPILDQKTADLRAALAGRGDPDTVTMRFQTAKGSRYEFFGDGTTKRDKAARSDAGHEGDSGAKPRTARTVYVEENAAVLSAAGIQGLGPKGARVVIRNGKASLLTWNDAAGTWGRSPSGTDVPVFDEIAVGRYPLELWKPADDVPSGFVGFRGMHAGNKITSIEPVALGDIDIPLDDGSVVKLSAGLDDLDAGDRAADFLALCGMGPGRTEA